MQAWVGSELDEGRVRPLERGVLRMKPVGGLWTSTFDERYGSGWVQWCLAEEFGRSRGDPVFPIWTLDPNPEARVYEVDSYADLEALHERYGDFAPPPRSRLPIFDLSHFGVPWLDWHRIAEDFDAVHLTEEGQWATRLTAPLNLYGWDCESTLWLRWAFVCTRDLGPMSYEAPRDPWWEQATVAADD